MKSVEFQSFHPSLDASKTVMIDGYATGFRMISHWPGHDTPEALRHDLTTGSCLKFVEMSQSAQRDVLGEFSVVTNNHYGGKAVANALQLIHRIKNAKVDVPPPLLQCFPELKEIASEESHTATLFPQ